MRRLALAVAVLAAPASAQAVYRWTDQHGEVHYTDDPSTVPRGVKVETTEGEALTVVPAAPAPPPKRKATTPAPPTRPAPPAQRGPIEVRLARLEVEVSPEDQHYITDSLQRALESPQLATWGPLRQSVDVVIAPGSRMGAEAFGMAVGLNVMLLRAPNDTPHVLALPYELTAVHELAHLLEHQTAGLTRPRWFAEGFASYVTGDTRAASLDDVAWWVVHEGGARPLDHMFSTPGACNVHVAYAIARQALVFLVEKVGEAGIKRMFELRAGGATFEAAFKKVAELSVDEFQSQFTQWLRPHYYERAR